MKVEWIVYGKIRRIQKADVEISYRYDAGGNRIWKKVGDKETFYARDASGNVLSIYTIDGAGSELKQSEVHLYGSSRLGILNLDRSVEKPEVNRSGIVTFRRGNKFFELSNHLGNVLATVSDKKLAVSGDGSTVDYYEAEVVSAQDYYPFGMMMPGRKYDAGDYRYGYGGHEKNDEVSGSGNNVDMGDRWLDTRLGRTSKPDAKGTMFPGVSPYSYAMNSPINAVDPDGKVVIFINGYYGFPTAACCGGTEAHWGSNWVSRVQNQIGDRKARYYDGSLGGTSGVLFGQGDPVLGNSSSMDPATRRLAGYNLGKTEAADIVNNLQRDEHGNITESIKFVTSSMGAAYQRGFSQAIVEYVAEQNIAIDAYNNGLAKNKDGSYADPSLVKQRLNVNIEFTVDLDAFQGSQLSADPNSNANYYMVNDGAESYFIGSGVPGSTQIGTNKNGKTTMHGHHPSWADPKAMPKGTQNPTGSGKKENPSD